MHPPRTAAGLFFLSCVFFSLFIARYVLAESNWPTYQQNGNRNAYVATTVQPELLSLKWTHESPQPPQPAWYGPAKWDAYANLRDLHSMRNYDPVFHVVGDDDRIYFGSSVEHCVTCLDGVTGDRQWSYFTNGPVRVPPTLVEGKLYFGSDDGNAYCLDAKSGKLLWKFSPTESNRLIVNNGNYVPMWPIRTGVTVDRGTAYFAASLLPWNKSYLCALDAKSGKPRGKGRFVRELESVTLEGPFAFSGGALIAPQGRIPPMLFSRADGKMLGTLEGGGGAFVVVAGDQVLHGPGNKEGWITRSNASSRDRLATHKHARGVVVIEGTSYLLTRDSVLALREVGKKSLWRSSCDDPLTLIGVGDYLFVGGIDQVTAFNRNTGGECWRTPVEGRAFGLAFAGDRLTVSTDTGAIYSFGQSGQRAAAPADTALAVEENRSAKEAEPTSDTPDVPLAPIATNDHPALIGRWVFQEPHTIGSQANDLTKLNDAQIEGTAQLERLGGFEALVLDGQGTTVTIAENHANAKLPTASIAAEAWIRVDEPLQWGGIVGAVHDNGSEEHGWVLGYRDSSFSFALAGTGGDTGLSYLVAPEAFVPGTWHHLVGCYDGKQMQLYVDGQLAAASQAQQGAIDYPTETPYVIGTYQDSNENFPLTGRIHEVCVYSKVLTAAEVKAKYLAAASRFPTAPVESEPKEQPHMVAAGPWLEFISQNEAVVRWQTEAPKPTRLSYRLNEETQTISSSKETINHEVRLENLKHNRTYYYTIYDTLGENEQGESQQTAEYECDTFFNYYVANPTVNAESELQPTLGQIPDSAIGAILASSGTQRGLCLDLDIRTAELAREIVKRTQMRVVGVTDNAERAKSLRTQLQAEGLYGTRILVLLVNDLKQLPLTAHSANVIVSEASLLSSKNIITPLAEVMRLVAPRGKVQLFCHRNSPDFKALRTSLHRQARRAGVEQSGMKVQEASHATDTENSVALLTLTGPVSQEAGDWSHAYGRADNSAYGGEALAGVQSRDELAVQWIGRPGPRYQSDRSGRKPPPLSTAGRVYLQGLHRMVAVDNHNGTILWSLETPHFERVNMPRDCSNWCADDNYVYATIRDRCWKINAATGKVEQMLPVSADGLAGEAYEWGYIASMNDALVGTAVRQGTSSLDFWGGSGWYDGIDGEAVQKVCSDRLYALDKQSGRERWSYEGSLVLNSTITADENHIVFVESRDPDLIAAQERRIGDKRLYDSLYLVALNISSGEQAWEQPLEIAQPDVALTLAFGQGRLALVSSNAASKSFHVYNYGANNGDLAWNQKLTWGKGTNDHGTHLSRPAIVGNRLVVRPGVMDLSTGELSTVQMPVSGCGTYACTSSAMMFRAWSGQDFAIWSFENENYTRWPRLRSDCWLSAIPADGLLLAPEGGGGCSCGNWLETSLAFIPKSRLDK